jgi:hypothetical protein
MGDPFPQANFLVIVKKMGFGQKAVKALLAVCLMTPHAGLTDPWRAHFLDEEDTVARLFLQHVSIGDDEPTCKNHRATGLSSLCEASKNAFTAICREPIFLINTTKCQTPFFRRFQ